MTRQGFYQRSYTLQEVADLMAEAMDGRESNGNLKDELTAARVAVRRVLTQLEDELSPAEYARLAGLIFTGTNTIAQIMRTQRTLSREAAEGWAKVLNEALDKLAEELGTEL